MYEFIKKILGYFSNFNTLVQFIFAIIALFVVVFLVVFRFRSFIYKMLKDYKVGFFRSFRLSFKCRKNSKKSIRFFVEYAMLKYIDQNIKGNCDKPRKIWRNIIRDFFNNYQLNDEKTYVVELESTFILDNANIRELIKNYFYLLGQKKYKKRFGLSDNAPLSFVSSIGFKSGFLLFTTFITGLQKIYRENWQSVIEKYIEDYKKYNKGFLHDSEYFSIFNWLTWGPSYEVGFEDDDYKILQYGLFDETTSNCLVLCNDAQSLKVWQKIKEKRQQGLGFFYSAKCKICDTKTFFKHNERHFGIVSKPIIDRIKSPANEINFVLCFVDEYEEKKASLPIYLFTSYVWLMLHWKDESGRAAKAFDSETFDDVKFNLDNAALFFEDTNVADKENFISQIGIIIDKTFKHLEGIFNDSRFNGRKYYFICSINDYTEQEFIKEYNRRIKEDNDFAKKLKTRLDIKMKPFTLNTVMKSIEKKFGETDFDLRHYEIDINNLKDLHLFNTFYKDFMVKEFPDENERETIDNLFIQIDKFNKIKNKTGDRYHVIISKLKDDIIGGVFACYFEKTNSALLEYIVVYDKFRSKGIGSELLNNLYTVLDNDAINAGNKCLDYIFIETENPEKAPSDKAENKNRLEVWKRWHFSKVNLNYIQPALSEGKKDVDYLFLGVRLMNEKIKTLKAETLISFLKDSYYFSMSKENPEADKNFIAMKDEILKDKTLNSDIKLKEF